MKRLVFLSLSLLVLISGILISGCSTFSARPTEIIPPSGAPSIIGTFSNSPSTINPGGTSTLVWNVAGADSVSIDQGIGVVNAAGAREVSPAKSTVYTISATNSAGTVTRSSLTTVNLVPLSTASVPFAVTSVTANTSLSTFTGTWLPYEAEQENKVGVITPMPIGPDGISIPTASQDNKVGIITPTPMGKPGISIGE